jgi:hypothetical protein
MKSACTVHQSININSNYNKLLASHTNQTDAREAILKARTCNLYTLYYFKAQFIKHSAIHFERLCYLDNFSHENIEFDIYQKDIFFILLESWSANSKARQFNENYYQPIIQFLEKQIHLLINNRVQYLNSSNALVQKMFIPKVLMEIILQIEKYFPKSINKNFYSCHSKLSNDITSDIDAYTSISLAECEEFFINRLIIDWKITNLKPNYYSDPIRNVLVEHIEIQLEKNGDSVKIDLHCGIDNITDIANPLSKHCTDFDIGTIVSDKFGNVYYLYGLITNSPYLFHRTGNPIYIPKNGYDETNFYIDNPICLLRKFCLLASTENHTISETKFQNKFLIGINLIEKFSDDFLFDLFKEKIQYNNMLIVKNGLPEKVIIKRFIRAFKYGEANSNYNLLLKSGLLRILLLLIKHKYKISFSLITEDEKLIIDKTLKNDYSKILNLWDSFYNSQTEKQFELRQCVNDDEIKKFIYETLLNTSEECEVATSLSPTSEDDSSYKEERKRLKKLRRQELVSIKQEINLMEYEDNISHILRKTEFKKKDEVKVIKRKKIKNKINNENINSLNFSQKIYSTEVLKEKPKENNHVEISHNSIFSHILENRLNINFNKKLSIITIFSIENVKIYNIQIKNKKIQFSIEIFLSDNENFFGIGKINIDLLELNKSIEENLLNLYKSRKIQYQEEESFLEINKTKFRYGIFYSENGIFNYKINWNKCFQDGSYNSEFGISEIKYNGLNYRIQFIDGALFEGNVTENGFYSGKLNGYNFEGIRIKNEDLTFSFKGVINFIKDKYYDTIFFDIIIRNYEKIKSYSQFLQYNICSENRYTSIFLSYAENIKHLIQSNKILHPNIKSTLKQIKFSGLFSSIKNRQNFNFIEGEFIRRVDEKRIIEYNLQNSSIAFNGKYTEFYDTENKNIKCKFSVPFNFNGNINTGEKNKFSIFNIDENSFAGESVGSIPQAGYSILKGDIYKIETDDVHFHTIPSQSIYLKHRIKMPVELPIQNAVLNHQNIIYGNRYETEVTLDDKKFKIILSDSGKFVFHNPTLLKKSTPKNKLKTEIIHDVLFGCKFSGMERLDIKNRKVYCGSILIKKEYFYKLNILNNFIYSVITLEESITDGSDLIKLPTLLDKQILLLNNNFLISFNYMQKDLKNKFVMDMEFQGEFYIEENYIIFKFGKLIKNISSHEEITYECHDFIFSPKAHYSNTKLNYKFITPWYYEGESNLKLLPMKSEIQNFQFSDSTFYGEIIDSFPQNGILLRNDGNLFKISNEKDVALLIRHDLNESKEDLLKRIQIIHHRKNQIDGINLFEDINQKPFVSKYITIDDKKYVLTKTLDSDHPILTSLDKFKNHQLKLLRTTDVCPKESIIKMMHQNLQLHSMQ